MKKRQIEVHGNLCLLALILLKYVLSKVDLQVFKLKRQFPTSVTDSDATRPIKLHLEIIEIKNHSCHLALI